MTTQALLDIKEPIFKIEHNGITLEFRMSVTVFRKANFNEIDVFAEINQFWANLPPKEQDYIFSKYQEIHDKFQMTQYDLSRLWDRRDLDGIIRPIVTELVNAHDLGVIENWIMYRSGIRVPDNFKAVFVESIDNNTTEEKTYTRSDYIALLSMSMALRVMIPIWSEFIFRTLKETGQDFKEYYAFHLLRDTELHRSRQMNKLITYVNGAVADKKESLANVTRHISPEDYPLWMTAVVVVRRLCMSNLHGSDKANPVTGVYMYVWHKVTNPESNGEDQVKGKDNDDNTGNPTDKASMLERVRVKTNLSLGEVVELETSITDPILISQKLSMKIDPAHMKSAVDRMLNISNMVEPTEAQELLLRWVFKPVLPPNGQPYIESNINMQSLGVLEAALWARGHYYLAILATAQALKNERGFTASKVDSVSPVPAELTQKLKLYYPFDTTNQGRRGEVVVTNDVDTAIDTLTRKFTEHTWRATIDDHLLKQAIGSTNRNIVIRPDIKILITHLVIEIGSRSWT